jgi:hypothetical protein
VSPVVTMQDVRAARQCSRGARAFFARHGLDWSRFLREGLPVEQVEATGDAMALKVCAVARERHGGDA